MWKTVKLGEICDIAIGRTPPKRSVLERKGNTKRWLSIEITAINGNASDSKRIAAKREASRSSSSRDIL